MSGIRHEITALLVADVLADALKKAEGNGLLTYALLALLLPQLGLQGEAVEGGETNKALLDVIKAEQERFLERVKACRASGRARQARFRSKPSGAEGVMSRASNANVTGVSPSPRVEPVTDTVTDMSTTGVVDGAQSAQAHTSPAESSKSGKAKRPTMQPPTADEVRAFADEQGLAIDAERFVDYYTAQGWKLSNGRTMRDWKAAVKLWVRRDSSPSSPSTRPAISDIGGDDAKFHNAGW